MIRAALDYKGIVVDVLDPEESGMDATEISRCAAALEKAARRKGIVTPVSGYKPVSLPPPLTRMVAALLRELTDGCTVAVMATAEEVSTGVAALRSSAAGPRSRNAASDDQSAKRRPRGRGARQPRAWPDSAPSPSPEGFPPFQPRLQPHPPSDQSRPTARTT